MSERDRHHRACVCVHREDKSPSPNVIWKGMSIESDHVVVSCKEMLDT